MNNQQSATGNPEKISAKLDMPECDKLLAVHAERLVIMAFMDFLSEYGLTICKDDANGRFWPDRTPIDVLVAASFDIDMNVVEKERQLLIQKLHDLSNSNKPPQNL